MAKNQQLPGLMHSETVRDGKLLDARQWQKLAPDQMQRAIVLLLLCRSNEDRETVAFHILHKLPLGDVAAEIGKTPARIGDVWESLCARERLSCEKFGYEAYVRMAHKPQGRSHRRKKGQ